MKIVNPVAHDELEAWTKNLQTTFLVPPNPTTLASATATATDRLEPGRTWGARDHGRWVATLATDARTLTVPAARGTNTVPIDALTAVTVNATHRRRGLLSAMLTASLAAAKERGDALSYLIAAEWPIYGRFGYGPATRFARHTYFPRMRGAVIEAEARVRQIDAAEFAELGPVVFAASRTERAGEINRMPRFWRTQLEDEPREGRLNLVVHEGPDGPDGLLGWAPSRDFDIGEGYGAIQVHNLLAANPQAYAGLWAYLSGIDVVDEITLPLRPVDEPARFLMADGRALRTTFEGDHTWVALLDVPAALSARGYRASGRLVLDVVDRTPGGFANGRVALDASPDGATCTLTREPADLTLPATTLASAYLGDYPLALAPGARRVDEHTSGAVARFDLMFGTSLMPFCSTGF